MKKTYIQKALIICLGVFFFVSCNKDESNPTPNIKPNGLVFKATIAEGTTVKSGVVEDNDYTNGEKFKWVADDEIFVAFNTPTPATSGKFKAINITNNKKADFTNTESINLNAGTYNITAFSPYQSITDFTTVNLAIPQEQTQNGNTSNHIGLYNFMWAKKDNAEITAGQTLENVDLTFKHLNPVLRFSFKNVSGKDITIKKIELSTDATNSQFYKTGTVNLNSGAPMINNLTSEEYDTLKLALTNATVQSDYKIEQAPVFNAYMTLFPTTGYNSGEKFFITLTLDNGSNEYTKTIEMLADDYSFLLDGGGFQAGYSYYFKIAIADDGGGAVIPAGSFYMGSPDTEEGRTGTNENQHQVILTEGFRMAKYEITCAQFSNFLNAMGVGVSGASSNIEGGEILVQDSGYSMKFNGTEQKWKPAEGNENHPATYVSWYGANAYAKWVGGSLPTEAQWEYACRAETSATTATSPFNTGTSLTDSDATFNKGMTTNVGTHSPNAWGLYDMHGNAAEWCSDWYDENYYPYGGTTDPKGPDLGTFRVIRGGAYNSDGKSCRSAFRGQVSNGQLQANTGFRIVFND